MSKKDNTTLLVIGALVAGYFLIPKDVKEKIIPGGGGGITSIDIGAIPTETGLGDIGQQIQAGLFNLQVQGMRTMFDIQLAGLKNLITGLPQVGGLPLIGGEGGGGDGWLPDLGIPNLGMEGLGGVFPDLGLGVDKETGEKEPVGVKDGTTFERTGISWFERTFGIPLWGSVVEFLGIDQDGREDTPQSIKNLPERTLGVMDIWGGDRYFLPSGAETTKSIFEALREKGYPVEVITTEKPIADEASLDSHSPSASEVSDPGSAHYGASM